LLNKINGSDSNLVVYHNVQNTIGAFILINTSKVYDIFDSNNPNVIKTDLKITKEEDDLMIKNFWKIIISSSQFPDGEIGGRISNFFFKI
jgi:hypothetical protein